MTRLLWAAAWLLALLGGFLWGREVAGLCPNILPAPDPAPTATATVTVTPDIPPPPAEPDPSPLPIPPVTDRTFHCPDPTTPQEGF